jgi:E3 ubiquitin-protein ligase BRE1
MPPRLGVPQAREAARAAAARADALSHDLLAREEGLASLRAQLDAASATADRERRAREEEAEAAGRERAKRQRAEDEAKALQGKVARLRRSQDTAEVVQELETELGQVRKLLKCSVCCERQKNVIIKKCWHMFCKQCVDRVIEARSRKCPGCGHRFAEADVQAVYLT